MTLWRWLPKISDSKGVDDEFSSSFTRSYLRSVRRILVGLAYFEPFPVARSMVSEQILDQS